MKVGTDGVLLGAWTNCADAKSILDVGTGSGLIALMLAQRSEAQITAIDIDENACLQAQINFEASSFRDHLSVQSIALQTFPFSQKYDLIVSNPPYFVNSLQSPNVRRTKARHTGTLPFADLIRKSTQLLNPFGRLSLILPFNAWEEIHHLAQENKLFLTRKTLVSPLKNSPPKRLLLEFSKKQKPTEEAAFYLEEGQGKRSKAYKTLTEEYYL
ncbi:tRNA1(Val) (adenine(37)-N6)-methyltransferase [Bacteroidia bacterium]|nr:tRNA1(Val) (adenine(37)-N6)-methyltransferase [Bacteroidia bacterium]